MDYPRLVWVHSLNRQGEVHPERWEHECHTGAHVKDGKPEVIPHAASYALEPDDIGLPMDLLVRLYPPPSDYKWVRREVRKINPDEQLMEPPAFMSVAPEPEWIDDTG